MITNDCIEAAVAELSSFGIASRVEAGGKHAAVIWSHGDKERKFTTSLTPSDWRAPMNARSDIRRMLRNDGLIEAAPSTTISGPHIVLRNGQFFCDSRDIATHFDKQHKHVLRDIDKALAELGEFGRSNFGPISYLDASNRQQRAFSLTRDGFSYIAMGFTGTKAAEWKVKYLSAFNAMESELKSLASAAILPPEILNRIERVEGDLAALIDLSLSALAPKPGYIVVKPHLRKVRRAA